MDESYDYDTKFIESIYGTGLDFSDTASWTLIDFQGYIEETIKLIAAKKIHRMLCDANYAKLLLCLADVLSDFQNRKRGKNSTQWAVESLDEAYKCVTVICLCLKSNAHIKELVKSAMKLEDNLTSLTYYIKHL